MSTRSSGLIDSPSSIGDSQAIRNSSTVATDDPRLIRLMKSLYQADQQVEYLHLQAEVESLLRQLQILKKQRLDSVQPDVSLQGQ
ncbi:MAG: hypothetical protein KME25_21980 [Symplocastrum torsivum CPER-KK1]|uniref:Uncharacterized protein n=1 Tax=Symplocastrum torsivum CPER-KK1 TaxID=450513 RepID=A0A951PNS9_9CYAN|nr:hypothetical protein [Symplocastrum torsivum CPER-KK1]